MSHSNPEQGASRVAVKARETLSDFWGTLWCYTFEFLRRDGTRQLLKREVYDRGDGAAILLYNTQDNTVILTGQMRLPVFLAEGEGDLIEACAGLLDGEDPAAAIRREAEEEAGVSVKSVREIMTVYTSPGSVSERLHLFVGAYTKDMRTGAGGGLVQEGEEIAVLELPFLQAMTMIDDGRIKDAKTIILLQHAALKGLCSLAPG
ncbi:NUDIX domain-containing protein [Asaia astilbis]|uniref:NUDIX domain-containing protein n=1 Tax=Asaia astilbis TaxID=610244 RepID=UPI0004727F5E|nr:NUDIX domain-containing protein [Asaia astilbis]